jgi:hypothetical protein
MSQAAVIAGSSPRVTYVVQAVDKRGNVTFLEYTSASLPASGAPLHVAQHFDVTVVPGTTVTSFAPANGPVGATVQVTGTNLVGVTQVRFGGVPATSFTSVSATLLTAVVPAGAITGPIEVAAALGIGTSVVPFVVAAPPTIGSFSPGSGPIGTLVHVEGTNFVAGATSVAFNGTAAVAAVLSPTEIETSVPAEATTGKITVTTPYGTAESAASFTVIPTSTGGSAFYTVAPCRVLDTRNAGGPLAAQTSRTVAVAGTCEVPATAKAITFNLTVVAPTVAGALQVYPSDQSPPTTAAVNYSAGQTRGNNGIIGLSATGAVAVRNRQATGSAHVILDVSGYFE